jgi:hypothetical protein
MLKLSTVIAAGIAAWLAACGNRHRENKDPPHDARRARRVIEPSTDRVGPLPPYAIRADGIGPYKLGEKLSDLLEQLASGPRIALFEITGVVHRDVIHAEDDTILVGGEQASTASFVAVVGSEVARTESGIHVGSTREEVVTALGPPISDPEHARDPRLLVPNALPNLRAVLEGGHVAAIVVTIAATEPRHARGCERPPSTEAAIGACMTGAGELIEVGSDDVVIRSADGERMLVAPLRFPGLVFAAPLRSASDGRDELAVITRKDEAASRSWWISIYRFEGARLSRATDATPLYQLSSANARWIGADLRDVELYLELTSRPEAIDIGGLLATRSSSKTATKIRDVVVISPVQVARHRGKPVSAEANDASASGSASGASQAPRAILDAAVDLVAPPGVPPESSRPE